MGFAVISYMRFLADFGIWDMGYGEKNMGKIWEKIFTFLPLKPYSVMKKIWEIFTFLPLKPYSVLSNEKIWEIFTFLPLKPYSVMKKIWDMGYGIWGNKLSEISGTGNFFPIGFCGNR